MSGTFKFEAILIFPRFRWVSCQLDHLGDCYTIQECRDALKKLPPDLNETYLRILQRVKGSQTTLVQMALHFVAYAQPAPTIGQLRELLSVPTCGNSLGPQNLIHEDTIAKPCSSLVRKSNDGQHYEFAHFSVQEFLEGNWLDGKHQNLFKITKAHCNQLLASTCLSYIQLENFSPLPKFKCSKDWVEYIEKQKEVHNLYKYASLYWPKFARGQWHNKEIVNLAKRLFDPRKPVAFISWAIVFSNWIFYCGGDGDEDDNKYDNKHNPMDDYCRNIAKTRQVLEEIIGKNVTPLHFAAMLSIPELCKFLLDHKADVDIRCGLGNPIQCAIGGLWISWRGRFSSTFRTKLEKWYIEDYNREPFHQATVETINLLVAAGADPSTISSGDDGSTYSLVKMAMRFPVGCLPILTALVQSGMPMAESELDILLDGLSKQISKFPEWHSQFGEHCQHLLRELSGTKDRSPLVLKLCSLVWRFSISAGFQFAKDPYLVDTQISLTGADLSRCAIDCVKHGTAETLRRLLSDARLRPADIDAEYGESLLHLAVRLWFGKPIPGLELLLKYGFSVLSDDENEELKGCASLLMVHGVPLHAVDSEGRTPLHTALHTLHSWHLDGLEALNPWQNTQDQIVKGDRCYKSLGHMRLSALLNSATNQDLSRALRTTDRLGYTPLVLAIELEQVELALLLLTNCRNDAPTWKSPTTHVLRLAARAGSLPLYQGLLDAGVGVDAGDPGLLSPLHCLGSGATLEFIDYLKSQYKDACVQRLDGRLPLENFLQVWLCQEYILAGELDPRLVDALTSPSDMLSWIKSEGTAIWQYITKDLLPKGRAKAEQTKSYRLSGFCRRRVWNTAVDCLIRLGVLTAYESERQESGLVALEAAFSIGYSRMEHLYPLESQTFGRVIESTRYWRKICDSELPVRLLQAAVRSQDISFANILLERGASVHTRIYGVSALEVACSSSVWGPSEPRETDRTFFRLLLDKAGPSRINEINPGGLGLIHLVHQEWKIDELITQGANVNLCIGARECQPALMYHLQNGDVSVALALLKRGADPTLTNKFEFNAVQEVVRLNGGLVFLEALLAFENPPWQLDWSRTGSLSVIREGKSKGLPMVCNGLNLLHIAAACQNLSGLTFLTNKTPISNVNSRTEEFFTPMHFAAMIGHAEMVDFLLSKGARINAQDVDGATPLHLAISNSHLAVVKLLVQSGAQFTGDRDGSGRLTYAHRVGEAPMIEFLRLVHRQQASELEGNTLVKFETRVLPVLTNRHHKTLAAAFETAILNGALDSLRELHGQGCSLEADMPSCNGCSPLLCAILHAEFGIAQWLLEMGASPLRVSCKVHGSLSTLEAALKTKFPNPFLRSLLDKWLNAGGDVVDEFPNAVYSAVRAENSEGLSLLLGHVKQNSRIYE
jgi:ankyrin repeat protein